MATPNLPSATSVVDYLSSQKQDSSFGARAKIYKNAGLDKTLGDFVGSPSQNLNLLKHLQKSSAPTPTPATNTTTSLGYASPFSSAPTNPANPFAQAPTKPASPKATAQTTLSSFNPSFEPSFAPPSPIPPAVSTAMGGQTTPATAANLFDNAASQAAPTKPVAPGVTPTQTPTQGTAQTAPQNQTPEMVKDTQTKETTGGVSASTIYPELSTGNADASASETDLVNEWINSSEGQAFLARQEIKNRDTIGKAEAAKQVLETKFQSSKTTLENNLAEKGLAFSGVRASQVQALANSLAASLLETDRETATALLLANQDLTDAVLKGVAELAKKAKEDNKAAIAQLNLIGYAVIGDKLVPTLASRSAERADVNLQISERRLQLAEEAAVRAEARFEQLYGTGKSDQFDYVTQLMDLNPNATRAELKAAALQNTTLNSTEIDAVLDTVGLTQTQSTETAKALVASNFKAHFFKSNTTDLDDAKKAAKATLRATGGVLKIGGRTVALTADQLTEMENYIDTVTLEETKTTKNVLDNQE